MEALKLMKDPQFDKTIKFIQMFDKFFDCIIVSSLDAGKLTRNKFKALYHSSNDFRLKVIYTYFLYCTFWITVVEE